MGHPTPGDGSAQPRVRLRDFLSRTQLLAEVEGPDGVRHDYAARVGYFDDEPSVRLYTDGRESAVGEPPVTFEVPGATIEVATSIFGIKRAQVSVAGEPARTMRPARGTAEYARALFARRFPRASRLLGAAAVLFCLIGLVLAVPMLAEIVTSFDLVADRVGTFTSPISLPGWLTTTLFGLGLVAGLERALSLRNHWLIDADTWMLGP